MTPTGAVPDVMDSRTTNAVLRRKLSSGNKRPLASYFANLSGCQLTAWRFIAARTVTHHLVLDVLPMRSKVEMIWAHASPVITMVQNPLSVGNWPIVENPRDAVHSPLPGTGDVLHVKHTIAANDRPTLPFPTPVRLGDHTPEPVYTALHMIGVDVVDGASTPQSLVVEGAQRAPVVRARTAGKRARLHRGIIRYANAV